MPVSTTVRTSGASLNRWVPWLATIFSVPAFWCGSAEATPVTAKFTLLAIMSVMMAAVPL
ncbi:hypothetical protein D3C71_1752680 [compost metagenome]